MMLSAASILSFGELIVFAIVQQRRTAATVPQNYVAVSPADLSHQYRFLRPTTSGPTRIGPFFYVETAETEQLAARIRFLACDLRFR